MLAFHQSWFYVATMATGVVGVWGIALALRKQPPSRWFAIATGVAIVVMFVQVGAGLWLYGQGDEPDGLHTFYGVIIVITFALAYVYRGTMARRPALYYGLLLLFVMGLGLRAWTT